MLACFDTIILLAIRLWLYCLRQPCSYICRPTVAWVMKSVYKLCCAKVTNCFLLRSSPLHLQMLLCFISDDRQCSAALISIRLLRVQQSVAMATQPSSGVWRHPSRGPLCATVKSGPDQVSTAPLPVCRYSLLIYMTWRYRRPDSELE